ASATAPPQLGPLSLHDALPISVLTGGAERMPTRSTRSGRPTAHSSACIPPIDPPMTPAHTSMPRASARRTCAATWSRIVRYGNRSEEHTSELQSRENLVCRLLL